MLSEAQSIGIIIDTPPPMDGNVYRYPVEGKQHGKKNGWVVGRGRCITIGRWDTGQKIRITPDKSEVTAEDREHIRMINDRIRADKLAKQLEARLVAEKIMARATDKEHPYCVRKGIRPVVGGVVGDTYCIPMYHGQDLVNVQQIFPNGDKLYLAGAEKQGCAVSIPGDDKICICEGFATGCSISAATGYRVVVAFDAGNLVHVAKAVRERNPVARIIVCADNDHPNPGALKYGGTGIKFGRLAASACGGWLRYPDTPGKDFNDIPQDEARAIINRREGVCTVGEIEARSVDLTLKIPGPLMSVAGLISDGLDACSSDSEIPEIPQYSFPVILSVIARAIAGKIRFGKVWPNLYNIKVGGTSTGKTDVDIVIKNAVMSARLENFYGPTDFSSGPGLLRALSEPGCEKCIVNLDEVTYLFRRPETPDVISHGKMSALLELYTASGGELRKPYGDRSKSIKIEYPCVILLGNATPIIFDDFRYEDLQSGIIQRFDFWCYDGPIIYRTEYSGEPNDKMIKFIDGIGKVFSTPIIRKQGPHDLRAEIGCAVDVGCTSNCRNLLNEYSKTVIDAANAVEDRDSGGQGIMSRRYDLALKYGLIHMASTRPITKLPEPMSVIDLRWGIDMAEMLCKWKTDLLIGKITAGGFHRDCEIFKEGIMAVIKMGQRPTGKTIANRKRRIKQLKPREFDDVVKALVARDEIIVDESGPSTIYWLTTII